MAKEEKVTKSPEELLKEVMKDIKKQFGEGAIMRLGDKSDVAIDVIPSGSLSLDCALGVGGYPRGRVVEIYGPESSGKTTFALHAIAEAQKIGGRAAFIDAEHAIDPLYAKRLGVNIDDLILSQPDYGEQAMEIANMLIKSNHIDLIVIDSVAALVPQAELEGEMTDNQVGMQARLMSKALRKITGNLSNCNCTIIFINQLREKVGIMFGNPEVTPGGRALKFYASVRLEVRRGEAIKEGTDIIGNLVNVKIVKNKVAPPFKSCSLELIYGKGLSQPGEILDLAVSNEIARKSGPWYEYNGAKLGQGRENVIKYLLENQALFDEITLKVKEKIYSK